MQNKKHTPYLYENYFKAPDLIFSARASGAITEKELIIILYLFRRADKNGLCYPSMDTISKDTNISKSTIYRAIKKFQELNIINVYTITHPADKRKKLNVYEINPPDIWSIDLEELENNHYINEEIFKEKVLNELKKQKAQKELINIQDTSIKRYENSLNQASNNYFLLKMKHKEKNKYINKTKEKKNKLNAKSEKFLNKNLEKEKNKKLREEIESFDIKEIEK